MRRERKTFHISTFAYSAVPGAMWPYSERAFHLDADSRKLPTSTKLVARTLNGAVAVADLKAH